MIVRWIVLLLLMAGTDLHAQEYFSRAYADVWQRNMAYSKAVAEAMPEEYYDYGPTEEAMAFRGQFLHIVDNISYLTALITGTRKDFYRKEEMGNFTKLEVIDLLDAANRYVLDLIHTSSHSLLNEDILFRDVAMTKENLFYLLRDHQAHHRAQCLVYLRIKGIPAPGYVGW